MAQPNTHWAHTSNVDLFAIEVNEGEPSDIGTNTHTQAHLYTFIHTYTITHTLTCRQVILSVQTCVSESVCVSGTYVLECGYYPYGNGCICKYFVIQIPRYQTSIPCHFDAPLLHCWAMASLLGNEFLHSIHTLSALKTLSKKGPSKERKITIHFISIINHSEYICNKIETCN